MKLIWKLYIIFFIFSIFGDIGSTQVVMFTEEKVAEGVIPDMFVPDDCHCPRCTLPSHCDASPIIRQAQSAIQWFVTIPKLLYAVAVFFLILYKKMPPMFLLVLTLIFILATIWNLGVAFFTFAPVVILIIFFAMLVLINYFTNFKEDEDADS